MLVFPEQSLVILLPWKTASQSLRARLGRRNRSPYPLSYHYHPVLRRLLHQHITLPDFLSLPEARQGYRLAVFVRNPYDRVVSGFMQALRDSERPPLPPSVSPDWIRNLVVDQLVENRSFIARCGNDPGTWITRLPSYLVHEIGRNTSLFLHPCHYWTHLNGRCHVDFIGRVEQFEADFARLCEQFALTPDTLANVNVSAALTSSPDQHGYRHVGHLPAAAIARIEALFAEDFEIFGYPRIGSSIDTLPSGGAAARP